MNFDIDYRHTHIVRSPQAVPLIVLVREWGRYGQDAFLHADIILLILRAIQPQAHFQHGMEISEILDSLTDLEFRARFLKSLDEVLSDVMVFMQVCDDLSNLFASSEKANPPLLDVDCSNSAIGVYVRQCVLEMKKLTFSQLTRFHSGLLNYFKKTPQGGYLEVPLESVKSSQDKKTCQLKELDFVLKLKELIMWGPQEKREPFTISNSFNLAPSKMQLGSEALKLAELHGKFGHHKEGLYALEESIRLAQQNDHPLILEHALTWLLKMESFEEKDTLVMLQKFVKDAEDLRLVSLGLWGRLHRVKTQIAMSEAPHIVLENLLSSQVENPSSDRNFKEENREWALHMSSLAMLASTWEHYGHRLQALHYAQLVCHMTSCDPTPSPEVQESMALALVIIAKHLQQTGEVEKSLSLLKSSMAHFRDTGLPFKILCKCDREVKFDLAVERREYSLAKQHLIAIRTFDSAEASYRSAVLSYHMGRSSEAKRIAKDVIKSGRNADSKISPRLLSRCWQLLDDMNSDLSMSSLTDVSEHLAFCKKHHLPQHQAQLTLSKILLQHNCPLECLEAIKQCSLQVLANGSLEDRGLIHLLKAQALLIQAKDDPTTFQECVVSVLPLVEEAVSDFKSCVSLSNLNRAQVLKTCLQNCVNPSTEIEESL